MKGRGMLYKMLSTSVQYGPTFQGIQQVWFDSEGLDGTAMALLPSGKNQFALNPYFCDSLGHLTGFIMNCIMNYSDSIDLDDDVYVNRGHHCRKLSKLRIGNGDRRVHGCLYSPSVYGKPSIDAGKTPSIAVVHEIKPVVSEIPRSTSTLLQGTKHCSKTIFLFPDSAGSATSYVTLPPISADLRVIGLNSPYLTKPGVFKCALQGITDSYINEIRRRQPEGPYHLAGWSADGVSALILIDSPNPVGLGKLPKRIPDFLEKSGIFSAFEMSDKVHALPDWLFQHFCVFIKALDRSMPQPFERGSALRTTIIWVRDSVCKNPDDPRGMNWLLDNRSDFGPNGLDEFIGAENTSTFSMESANCFTMMREPVALSLCAMAREAVGIPGEMLSMVQ
ncbi:hypothetical protein DL764_002431 [Monosporascus ibericus]|uniref:Thioesterase domain-containing protein n=1 Tax=Monosporascus ibericus TaxID=155417 RepID=A0A4Q4TNQ8_9PEZI|nr:hypothetical protein DL764_002431 [Monosporascus ibericus]